MQSAWTEEEEEVFRNAMRSQSLRSKPRFSFAEVKLLLEEVTRNRYIVLKKFNSGVSAETKKQTWFDITAKVNSLGENRREVRQIMKKWADLKCDGRRRMAAMRGPKGSTLRKKNLGPVEIMVHKILVMAPGKDDEADLELCNISEGSQRWSHPAPRSRPRGNTQDFSPLSSPEKDMAGESFRSSPEFDFDLVEDEAMPIGFDEDEEDVKPEPLPNNSLMKNRPAFTYTRILPSSSTSSSTSLLAPSPSSPYPPTLPPHPSFASSNGNSFHSVPSSSMAPPSHLPVPLTPPPSSSSSILPPSYPPSYHPSLHTSSSTSSAPPPTHRVPAAGPAPSGLRGSPQERLARVASQSLQQQQVSGALLGSVSRSLEVMAQAVQQLVETQQDFVQESLQQQRHTLDILKDFSVSALALLRDRPTLHRAREPQKEESRMVEQQNVPVGNSEPQEPEPRNPEPLKPPPQDPEIQNPPLQNLEMQNPGQEDPEIQNPPLQNLEMQNPGQEDPEIQNPPLQNPEMQNPSQQDPEIQNPPLENLEMQNPGQQDPEIQNLVQQNPGQQNPEVQDSGCSSEPAPPGGEGQSWWL